MSRRKADLRSDSRYKPEAYTECLLTVLDDLQAMSLLTQIVGDEWKKDYRREFGINASAKYLSQNLKRTVLRCSDGLRHLIDTYQIQDKAAIGFSRERQEVIVQKADESSALIEYQDTGQTRKYRKQMQIINRMLEDAGPLVTSECKQVDDRQRFLTRKFTYGNFESGGRLWGGFWAQHIKREDRPAILPIQGERTVELDFRSMVVHLAYVMEGHAAPDGDQYAIPGLSPSSRPGIKKVLVSLFFDKKVRTRFPIKDGDSKNLFAPEDRAKGYAGVFDAIKERHSKIAHLFGQGAGHFLQFLESQVLVNALL